MITTYMLKVYCLQDCAYYFIKLEIVSQFERFHTVTQHVQMVNQTKSIGNNAEISVN